MRIFVTFIILVFCVSSSMAKDTNSYLRKLDETLKNNVIYSNKKEKAIDSLKLLIKTTDYKKLYNVYYQLGNEYLLYIPDSTMRYAQKNIKLAERVDNKRWLYESELLLANAYSVMGLYYSALEILNNIKAQALESNESRIIYYDSMRRIYSYMASFTDNKSELSHGYEVKQAEYRDTLLSMLPPSSTEYLLLRAENMMSKGKVKEARAILKPQLATLSESSNMYGRMAYSMAMTYYSHKMNVEDEDMYAKYLAMSAMSDVKAAVKENLALQQLAIELNKRGDVDRAYRYIKTSLDDAVFCNANLRSAEISGILPVIDAAYKQKIESKQNQLIVSLICVSILLVFLIVAVLLIYKQIKRLRIAQKHLKQSNLIKEEYISQFMNLCTTYIDKLNKFRQTVNRKITAGKIDDILRLTSSSHLASSEQREFYANFDNAFLHIYPMFVDEFNALLQPEQQIVLKSGEMLNTELRIYALLRLGIDDTSKIADFLHYSINTIYTYRNKMKNRAINRESFENKVMKIGEFA